MRMPPIHPLLFAAYPILFLWSSNIGSVRTEEIIIPILVSVGIALGLWQGLRIGFGWDMRRVGIWVSYVIFMCFSHWIFEAAASFVIYGKEKIVSNYYFFPLLVLHPNSRNTLDCSDTQEFGYINYRIERDELLFGDSLDTESIFCIYPCAGH